MAARLGESLLDATATGIESSVAATHALDRALNRSVRAKATFLSDDSARTPRLLERFARAAGLQQVLLLQSDGGLIAAARDVPAPAGSDDTARLALDAALEGAARELAGRAGDDDLHVERWAVPTAGIAPSLAVVRRLPDGTTAILVQRDTVFRRLRDATDPTRQAVRLERSPELAYVRFDAPAPTTPAGAVLALERELELPGGRRAVLRIGVERASVRDALAMQRRSAWIQGTLLTLLAAAAVALFSRQRRMRRRMEERMRRTERLSALGRLAAHVAHEVRNPLNAIGLGVQRIARKTERDDVRRIGESVLTEVDRLDRTVQEVLQAARPRPPRLESVDAAELAGMLRELAVPTAAARSIELTVDAPTGLSLAADADLVRGAVWNLLRNALQVSPEGSAVAVRIARADGFVRIAVDDRGPGLDEEQRARAFERSHRNAPAARGSGWR